MTKKSKTTSTSKFPATAKALTQELALDKAVAGQTEPTPPASKRTPKAKAAPAKKAAKKLSALDAAAKLLGDTGTAMTTGEMIEAMAKKGYWSSPNGLTPAATLYAAILREINTKGKESRFSKTERGKFALKQ
jgi:hypothetical protein